MNYSLSKSAALLQMSFATKVRFTSWMQKREKKDTLSVSIIYLDVHAGNNTMDHLFGNHLKTFRFSFFSTLILVSAVIT